MECTEESVALSDSETKRSESTNEDSSSCDASLKSNDQANCIDSGHVLQHKSSLTRLRTLEMYKAHPTD